MSTTAPTPELDRRYSSPGATPTAWAEVRDAVIRADLYWISTVRGDGRPHVTPLIAVWADGRMHFATGPGEQKQRNLEENPHCILTTGSSSMDDGLDVVVEGEAERVRDVGLLARLADMWVAKYGEVWRYLVTDDEGFRHPRADELAEEGIPALACVYSVRPHRVFAFRKGEVFSQTRFRFSG